MKYEKRLTNLLGVIKFLQVLDAKVMSSNKLYMNYSLNLVFQTSSICWSLFFDGRGGGGREVKKYGMEVEIDCFYFSEKQLLCFVNNESGKGRFFLNNCY